jgi:zinc protease
MRERRTAGLRRSEQSRRGTLRAVGGRRVTVAGLVGSALLFATPALAQYPTSPPPPMPLRPVHFPPFTTARLPDGLSLIVVAQHKQPVVTVTLAMQGGAAYDPPAKAGLASIVAELLTKGTESRTADQIAAQVEGAGGSISAGADDDFLRVSISSLAENLPQMIDVLADIVEHPAFPATELELARTRELSALQLALSQPAAIAERIFRHEVYGDHPYGLTETPATVRAITREDVLAFSRAHVRPGGALLVVAGDAQAATVERLARRAFASWAGTTTPPVFPAIPLREHSEIVLVNKPGSVQSNVLAGFPFISPRDPAVYPLTLMNKILGGGADSRLFEILREQKGWTYDAYSQFSHPKGTGMFVAGTQVRTPVTDSAVAEMLRQLNRIRDTVPADSEVTAAKDYLVGSFPLTLQTPQQIAGAVARARLLGLPDDYVPKFRDRLAAVTDSQLAAADRRYLTPDHMVVVVVGDAAKVLDGLRHLGLPVRIVDVDGKPLTEADLAAPPAPVEWATDRLVAARDSFRVLIQGNPIGALTTTIARGAEGGRQVVYITSASAIGSFAQSSDTVAIDAATFAPIRVRGGGRAAGQEESLTLDYAGTHVTGHAHTPRRGGVRDADVDTTLAAGTLDENEVTSLLPALPLAARGHWVLTAYSGREGVVRTVDVTVAGDTTVTVPAGTFDCWKVATTGGQVPTTYFVTRTAPYLVVRYAPTGPPIAFELVRHEP